MASDWHGLWTFWLDPVWVSLEQCPKRMPTFVPSWTDFGALFSCSLHLVCMLSHCFFDRWVLHGSGVGSTQSFETGRYHMLLGTTFVWWVAWGRKHRVFGARNRKNSRDGPTQDFQVDQWKQKDGGCQTRFWNCCFQRGDWFPNNSFSWFVDSCGGWQCSRITSACSTAKGIRQGAPLQTWSLHGRRGRTFLPLWSGKAFQPRNLSVGSGPARCQGTGTERMDMVWDEWISIGNELCSPQAERVRFWIRTWRRGTELPGQPSVLEFRGWNHQSFKSTLQSRGKVLWTIHDRRPAGRSRSNSALFQSCPYKYLVERYSSKCGVGSCKRLGTKLQHGVTWCAEHEPPSATATSKRSRSRSRARVTEPEEVDEEEEQEREEERGRQGHRASVRRRPVHEDEDGEEERGRQGHRSRELLRQAREDEEPPSRSRRRSQTKSPGHTPKGRSTIARSLSKMGLLSSPGSEPQNLLEDFFERLSEGQAEGLREDQVRRRMCAQKVMSPEQLLQGLIADGEFEQARGQRGLTKFLTRWRKDLASLEGEGRTDTDWSVVDQTTPPRAEASLNSSFSGTPVTPVTPEPAATPRQRMVEEKKGEGVRIATPGIYRDDRKAGAGEAGGGSTVEPVAEIAKAIQNQTAELASLVRYQSEGSAGQPAGTLKGLGKQSEELVFLMRACGQYSIKVGEGEHGQALANSLLAAQVGASTKLRNAGFRQKMSNRLAIGIAGPYWGTQERYGLGAADFVAFTDAELDQFASESRSQKTNVEQRPPPPNRFDEWVARVRRQTDVWCLTYGEEWRGVKSRALELLSEWHLAHPHRWPLNVIMDVWEELHWRFGEEMKELLRKLKREVGRETITLNELRFHALLPGPDGQAWLQMPSTFDIERPGAWFQSEVIPRIDRKQDRLLWNMTWQGTTRRDRPQGQTSAGGSQPITSDRPTLKNLWGPKLTPEEAQQAKERAPQDKNGTLLCWGHLSHIGCGVQGCQRSHEPLRGSFEGLDPCVQMQLLKRGGLKRMRVETPDSVTTKVKEIRAKMTKEKQEKIADGKKRGKAGAADTGEAAEKPKEEETGDAKAGGLAPKKVRFWEPPEEFKVDFTSGEDLEVLVKGPDRHWEKDVHRPERVHPGRNGESAPDDARELVRAAQELGNHPVLEAVGEASDDLYAWAAARIARDKSLKAEDLLGEMATYGLGDLAKAAAEILEQLHSTKAGSSRLVVRETLWAQGQPGQGSIELDGKVWRLWDYQEDVKMTEELSSLLKCPEPGVEKRQCVTLTMAAAAAWKQNGRRPTLAEVQELGQQMRLEQTRLAIEAMVALGDAEEVVTAVEHEIRVFAHDLITPHHEKDFRALAVFPLSALASAKLVVFRADYRGGLVVESVVGPQWEPGGWTITALIWKGHMTLLEPPADLNLETFFESEESSSTPVMGFTFYWHLRHDQPKTSPGKIHCRLCKQTRKTGEAVQVRQHSCLARIAVLGERDSTEVVTRGVRKAGEQHPDTALVLQEVFAGTGRITQEWKKTGPAQRPIEVYQHPHEKQGYRQHHDLTRPENQSSLLKQAKNGPANVWWIAAPCTSFCDWQLQNGGTRTFVQPEGDGTGPLHQSETTGNELSNFGASLFATALDHGAFPVAESSAASGRYPKQWDLPCWKQILSRDDVDWLEFPMCAWGLWPPGQSTEFYVHKTRIVFPKHPPLRRLLSRMCPGLSAHHRHVALKGCRDGTTVTRCTEAGAYALPFVTAVVAVLQSSLGGGLVSPQASLDARAGGDREEKREEQPPPKRRRTEEEEKAEDQLEAEVSGEEKHEEQEGKEAEVEDQEVEDQATIAEDAEDAESGEADQAEEAERTEVDEGNEQRDDEEEGIETGAEEGPEIPEEHQGEDELRGVWRSPRQEDEVARKARKICFGGTWGWRRQMGSGCSARMALQNSPTTQADFVCASTPWPSNQPRPASEWETHHSADGQRSQGHCWRWLESRGSRRRWLWFLERTHSVYHAR